MADTREQRYGKVIWETSRADEGTISATGANIVARAVMAVADEEIENEVARLKIAEARERDLREISEATLERVRAALMQGGQTDRIRWRDAVRALAAEYEANYTDQQPETD